METTDDSPSVTTAAAVHAEFAAFYERELPSQVRRAALICGSIDAAHDIVHDAMIEVFRRWKHVDKPANYLSRSVLNACRDHARRHANHIRLLPRLVDPAADSPDEMLDDLVDALPFNQRAAVVLRFYGGLTAPEIADAMGCSIGSVGPWIARALKTLEGALR